MSAKKKKSCLVKQNKTTITPTVQEIFFKKKKKEGKRPGPHYLFSFLPIQPNTLPKSFPSYFFSKIFHLPYFTSKQTHPNMVHTWQVSHDIVKYTCKNSWEIDKKSQQRLT